MGGEIGGENAGGNGGDNGGGAGTTRSVSPGDFAGDITKWTGVFTTVLAAATAVGGGAATLSGGAERMFREQPIYALIAVMGGVIGFALLALGAVVGRTKHERSRAIAWSIIGFVVALSFGTVAVLKTSASIDQPGITGVITVTDGRPKVELTVTASGVRSNERLNVMVFGVDASNKRDQLPLLATVVGANRDGVANATFTIDLAGETYAKVVAAAWAIKPQPEACASMEKGDPRFDKECSAPPVPDCNDVSRGASDRAACLVLTVPGSAQRPGLDLSLTRADHALTLTGTVSALPERGNVVYLSISRSGSTDVLYSTKLVPSLDGSISATLDIGLDPALTDICVVAVEAVSSPLMVPPCPVPLQASQGDFSAYTTWLELTAMPVSTESQSPSADPAATATPE